MLSRILYHGYKIAYESNDEEVPRMFYLELLLKDVVIDFSEFHIEDYSSATGCVKDLKLLIFIAVFCEPEFFL